MKKVGLIFGVVGFFVLGLMLTRRVSDPAAQSTPVKRIAIEAAENDISEKLAGVGENSPAVSLNLDQQVRECLNLNTSTASLLTRPDFELDIENFHYADADGTEKRAQLQPIASEIQAGRIELKFFSVDSEGLPILLQTIRENWTSLLSDVLKQRKVFFHQKRGHIVSEELGSVSLLVENDMIRELQWIKGEKQLRCSDQLCSCN